MRTAIVLLLLATVVSQPLYAANIRIIPPQFGPQGDLIHNPECGYLKDAFLDLMCDGFEG